MKNFRFCVSLLIALTLITYPRHAAAQGGNCTSPDGCLQVETLMPQSVTNPSASEAPKAGTRAETVPQKAVNGRLKLVDTITTPTDAPTWFYSPVRCDSDGDLHLPVEIVERPVIQKLSPKGERKALFEASNGPDVKVSAAAWYAIEPGGGDLYQLILSTREITGYIFAYKSDGSFKSAVKLQAGFPFSPSRLAVFPSGQFLVAGEEYDADRKAMKWPFTGIFAADGTLLKELKLEDDEVLHDMAASGDWRVTLPTNSQSNLAIDYGSLEMGDDGNAYLMRWTNPTIFYAISPGGEVVRRFTVDPGDTGFRPAAFHMTKGRIAVFYMDRQTGDRLMKIVGSDGQDIATYVAPRSDIKKNGEIGTSFACYTEDPTRFTFLGADDNRKLQFLIAEPR